MYPKTTAVNTVAVEDFTSTATALRAACAGNTTIDFFPQREARKVPAAARTLCDSCPLRDPCLAWAISFDAEGYWAGTTTLQRRGDVPPEKKPLHDGPGTASLYRRVPGRDRGCRCDECCEAQTDRLREYRRNRGTGGSE